MTLIKHREISFCPLHADPHQARSATLALADLEGVLEVKPIDSHHLQISYDLQLISLQLIEALLEELGYHLDNSLLVKLRRALYHYTESVERENSREQESQINLNNNTQKVFINRYYHTDHSCRDHRPPHWRRYL